MNQENLFHETWENALHDVVIALGGYKEVAHRMWPTMKLQSAYSKLKAYLDEQNEREKPSLTEIETLIRWGREIGVHTACFYICDAGGYQRPDPVNLEHKRDALMEQYIRSVDDQKKILAQMEKLTNA